MIAARIEAQGIPSHRRGAVEWLSAPLLLLALALLAPFSIRADPKSQLFDRTRDFTGKEAFEAFAEAWPDRFSKVEQLDGDWAVRLDDRWFRWANGRLLPVEVKNDKAWDPWPFYHYPVEVPPVRKLDPEERRALDAELAKRDSAPDHRDSAFFDLLFHAPNHDGAWDRMKTILFFGHELLVNPDILEEMAAIERELKAEALTDSSVADWIDSIGSVDGFAWRSIAGTASRSMHSYGMAIDIVPAKSRGRAWYWLDARKSGLPWYELPRSQRIPVPDKVVKVFEHFGFVWGGKWFYWDLVHFEYRPDLLILNGMKAVLQESLP
ncbi:MAG TPA: M15 family metallopeptidase [Rectinemataceae bacterium]|nr:M15 family metallopeptidase [Rectinemataceae bacterium]